VGLLLHAQFEALDEGVALVGDLVFYVVDALPEAALVSLHLLQLGLEAVLFVHGGRLPDLAAEDGEAVSRGSGC
jgi:hypothetical protein